MATARPKADSLDSVAEEAVRILDVERLFDNPRSAEKVFTQIARCDDFVEAETPQDPDKTFSRMALELAQQLIQYATDLNALGSAHRWLAAKGLLENNGDAMAVLAKLTLVHTLNRGAQHYPKDPKWKGMKKRLERSKQLPRMPSLQLT